MTRVLPIIACGIVGLFVGWISSLWLRPSSTPGRSHEMQRPRPSLLKKSPMPDFIAAVTSDHPGRVGFNAYRDFYTRLADTTFSKCREWLLRLLQTKSRDAIWMRRAIVTRMAQLDPVQAVAVVNKHDLLSESRGLDIVFRIWAGKDPDAALDHLLQNKSIEDYAGLYSVIHQFPLERWDQLLAKLEDAKIDATHPHYLASAISRLGKLNPERAANMAVSRGGMSTGLENVINGWTNRDPKAALGWAMTLDDDSHRIRSLRYIANAWIQKNPIEGLEALWNVADLSGLDNHSTAIPTSAMSEGDFKRILNWLNAHAGQNQKNADYVLQAMMIGMDGRHPERLGTIVSQLGTTDLPNLIMRMSRPLAQWADQDPTAVQTFINSIDSQAVQEKAIHALIAHWSKNDPLRAVQFMQSVDLPANSIDIDLHSLMRSVDSTEDVLARIPETYRDHFLISYAEAAARIDAAQTVAHLVKQSASDNRENALAVAVGHWALEDRKAAAAWVQDMPPGDAKTFGAKNIADTWARRDVDGAHQWASSLTDEASRAKALFAVTEIAQADFPERAVEIAKEIPNPQDRRRALEGSLINLAGTDPDAADAWLASGEIILSQNERAIITSTAQRTRVFRQLLNGRE